MGPITSRWVEVWGLRDVAVRLRRSAERSDSGRLDMLDRRPLIFDWSISDFSAFDSQYVGMLGSICFAHAVMPPVTLIALRPVCRMASTALALRPPSLQ